MNETELEVIFNEWRELYNRYRYKGLLLPNDRIRFIELSEKLREAGCFQRKPSMLEGDPGNQW